MNTILCVALAMAAGPPLETSSAPTTRLYVRTLPPGAAVAVDGQAIGRSDGLFLVPPGVRKLTVELDGYANQTRQVEVREGWISRVQIELGNRRKTGRSEDPWAGWTYHPPHPGTNPPRVPAAQNILTVQDEPTPILWVSDDRVYLSYVDDTAEGKRSIAGSGNAVRFQRPAESNKLVAVEIFASRYGYPQPEDDFHVYVLGELGEHQQVIRDLSFTYKEIQRGDLRWYTLPIEPTEVPRQFTIALWFNPRQTNTIHLGMDEGVDQSHSYTGLPDRGLTPVDGKFDWMIRAVVMPAPKSVEVH